MVWVNIKWMPPVNEWLTKTLVIKYAIGCPKLALKFIVLILVTLLTISLEPIFSSYENCNFVNSCKKEPCYCFSLHPSSSKIMREKKWGHHQFIKNEAVFLFQHNWGRLQFIKNEVVFLFATKIRLSSIVKKN